MKQLNIDVLGFVMAEMAHLSESAMLNHEAGFETFGITDDFNFDEILTGPGFQDLEVLSAPEAAHVDDGTLPLPSQSDLGQANQETHEEHPEMIDFDNPIDLDMAFDGFLDMEELWSKPTTPPATPPSIAAISKPTSSDLEGVSDWHDAQGLELHNGEGHTRSFTTFADSHGTGISDDHGDNMTPGTEGWRKIDDSGPEMEFKLSGDDAQNSRSPSETSQLSLCIKFRTEDSKRYLRDLISEVPTSRPTRQRSTTKRLADFDVSDADPEPPLDLTNHPCARGCWECFNLRIVCPLLENEEDWPCQTCAEDGHDCELITAPDVKRACERCRRNRIPCSFKSIFDQGEACQQCMDDGHHCIAGPAKDFILPRLTYDWDWSNDAYRMKKRARLLEDPMGLQGHRKEDEFIRDIPVSQEDRKTKKRRKPDADDSTSKSKKLRKEEGTHASRSKPSSIRTITTKFCHPIKFNHVDQTGGSEPCHFCVEPSFSMLGLAAKEVKVREMKDARGLEEVSGGHIADGVDNTRVCASCTLQRMNVIACSVRDRERWTLS